MKKIFSILMILVLLVSLTGCNKKNPDPEPENQTDGAKFAEEYNSINGTQNQSGKTYRTLNISDDNPFVYSTAEEIVEKMENKETFIVYFGFKTCPWCRSMIEELIRCAKDNNQDKIYYVDVLDIRDKKEVAEDKTINTTAEGSVGYNKLLELMSDVLEDYNLTLEDGTEVPTGEKRIYAPNVVGVVNGNAEKMAEGISEQLEDPYGEITDEMKEDSYAQLKCVFECVGKDSNMCKKNAC